MAVAVEGKRIEAACGCIFWRGADRDGRTKFFIEPCDPCIPCLVQRAAIEETRRLHMRIEVRIG